MYKSFLLLAEPWQTGNIFFRRWSAPLLYRTHVSTGLFGTLNSMPLFCIAEFLSALSIKHKTIVGRNGKEIFKLIIKKKRTRATKSKKGNYTKWQVEGNGSKGKGARKISLTNLQFWKVFFSFLFCFVNRRIIRVWNIAPTTTSEVSAEVHLL